MSRIAARVAIAACFPVLLAAPASAEHRQRHQERRIVQELAHEVERWARETHRAAENRAHHGGYRELRALQALHRLEEHARHFNRQVERSHPDRHHRHRDFDTLYDTYTDASHRFRDLHAERSVWERFRRLGATMDELASRYSSYAGWSGGRGRGDDRGHDRFGWGDRRHDVYSDDGTGEWNGDGSDEWTPEDKSSSGDRRSHRPR